MTIFDVAKLAKVEALPQVYELKPNVPYVCFCDPEKFDFRALAAIEWPEGYEDIQMQFIAVRDGEPTPEVAQYLKEWLEEVTANA